LWLKADLHIHAHPSDRGLPDLEPEALATAAQDQGLTLVAMTDHDTVDYIDSVSVACAARDIRVLPGVEVTTSRGHLLCYAPTDDGVQQLRSLMARAGIRPGAEPDCDEVLRIIASDSCPTTQTPFASCVVTVAAHAERDRSMLAGSDSSTSADQLERIAKLDAVELTDVDLANQWASQGIKSTGLDKPLLVGSDAHSLETVGARHTWLYIHGGLSPSTLRQALSSADVSLRRGGDRPAGPAFYLTRIRVEGGGGLHEGLDIELHPRLNAIIGPPSIGKSLIVDVLRQAFGDVCQIDEIASMSERRMAATLPEGSVITVDAVVDGEPQQFRREVGGAAVPAPVHRPIAFSQGELTSRAMATRPELELTDVHADELESAQQRHAATQGEVSEVVHKAVQLAQKIKHHAETLGNAVDGLSVVSQKLDNLSPARDVARRLQALQAARSWRRRTLEALTPSLDLKLDEPQLPIPPTEAEGQESVSQWVDDAKVRELVAMLEQSLAELASQHKKKAANLLGPDPRLETAVQEAETALSTALQERDGQPGEESSALLARIKALHDRKVELEELDRERVSLEDDLESALADLEAHLETQAEASEAVLTARKDACRTVTEHIRGFYCRVTSDEHQSRLALVRSLKTGLREPALLTYCEQMEAMQLARDVVEAIRSEEADDAADATDTTHRRCVEKIVTEQYWQSLSDLVTSRTDERLHIEQSSRDGASLTFDRMTEGTRALAIKEISFAASDRPVVSDQPEDSVPTRAVFDELVPTLRTQRAERQFIVVSHDANIVVGSDADHVVVLARGGILTGNLHEATISRAALENLEGGELAFERRRQRYSSWRGASDGDEDAAG
jgi:hypothetical protein